MCKSSRHWYQQTYLELQAIQEALLDLAQVTDTYLGLDGPSFSVAKDALLEVLSFVWRWSEELGGVGASKDVNKQREANVTKPIIESASKNGQNEIVVANEHKVAESSLTINLDTQMQRTQALSQLREVAAFFRHTEPHSPVTYLAEKAADWGEMCLHEWQATVIKDGQTLQQMGELLGITLENKGDS